MAENNVAQAMFNCTPFGAAVNLSKTVMGTAGGVLTGNFDAAGQALQDGFDNSAFGMVVHDIRYPENMGQYNPQGLPRDTVISQMMSTAGLLLPDIEKYAKRVYGQDGIFGDAFSFEGDKNAVAAMTTKLQADTFGAPQIDGISPSMLAAGMKGETYSQYVDELFKNDMGARYPGESFDTDSPWYQSKKEAFANDVMQKDMQLMGINNPDAFKSMADDVIRAKMGQAYGMMSPERLAQYQLSAQSFPGMQGAMDAYDRHYRETADGFGIASHDAGDNVFAGTKIPENAKGGSYDDSFAKGVRELVAEALGSVVEATKKLSEKTENAPEVGHTIEASF